MKNSGVSKHIIMFCAPFLLYAIAVVLIFMFLFTSFTETNALWRAFTNNQSEVTVKNEGVDDEIDFVVPEPVVDEEEKVYYDINTFPSIKWGKRWATLTVEYLGAKDISVYEGDTDTILNYGIAHYYFSKFPGQDGNCVLSFHVNRQKQLYYLQDIPLGEKVIINTSYGKYVYEVVSKDVFEADDKQYVVRNEGEMLTIYTCYPNKGPYRKQRIAVTCAFLEDLSDPTWR
jgi:LPXTG-site transpeptidase (sortase) family protein